MKISWPSRPRNTLGGLYPEGVSVGREKGLIFKDLDPGLYCIRINEDLCRKACIGCVGSYQSSSFKQLYVIISVVIELMLFNFHFVLSTIHSYFTCAVNTLYIES